jgi:hypothetical protein
VDVGVEHRSIFEAVGVCVEYRTIDDVVRLLFTDNAHRCGEVIAAGSKSGAASATGSANGTRRS